ncbi:HipA domain-containing protein [Dyadobacter crusticola]|uniref:HipA domain-containing protein n=1 Tax=Dyadobacter crusticola TaxID=292407 RepID=UPI00054EAC48|nr:HipA domain-containing protein [Dyadobacter crusticola]
MQCAACYRDSKHDFCPKCSKRLFDGTKIAARLAYAAPKADNLPEYLRHTTRLSISGVQLKYSLRRDEKALVLTENKGEYIVKPIPPSTQLVAIEDAPENEHLTMEIAEQVFNILTAANALIYFNDGQPAYITRRFDLKADGTKYQQEDFAQLLNRTSVSDGQNYKYDATYEEIGILIRKHVAAAPPAIEALFRLVVFNYIVGNGDAHLKNFSLIQHESGEYRMTPAYDLMSTKLHTPYESDIALELYDGCLDTAFYSVNGYYGRPDFIGFAKRLGISDKRATGILDFFTNHEKQVITLVERSRLSQESKSKYAKIMRDRLLRLRGR